jgi:predicted RNase H-like HicB family nuclease
MAERTYVIRATWDNEAGVWVAVSDDVPGLVAEGSEVETLIQKLKVLIPELLEASGLLPKHGQQKIVLPFELRAQYRVNA